MTTKKKKILYLGVALVSAYFLLPQAQTMLDYVKNKIKSIKNKDSDKKNN